MNSNGYLEPGDLMVGNWIQDTYMVINLSYVQVKFIRPDLWNDDQFYGVFLDSEVLTKMGFITENNEKPEGGLFIPFQNGRLYWCGSNVFKYFVGYAPIMQWDLDYVHQLQNLLAIHSIKLEFDLTL